MYSLLPTVMYFPSLRFLVTLSFLHYFHFIDPTPRLIFHFLKMFASVTCSTVITYIFTAFFIHTTHSFFHHLHCGRQRQILMIIPLEEIVQTVQFFLNIGMVYIYMYVYLEAYLICWLGLPDPLRYASTKHCLLEGKFLIYSFKLFEEISDRVYIYCWFLFFWNKHVCYNQQKRNHYFFSTHTIDIASDRFLRTFLTLLMFLSPQTTCLFLYA